ncbi:heterokaryon incompatibility protein-domain-containing protein [Xylaria scruposa]|nr:heterokaryon incompatibility protein-domain-containing protein [Xylaria scruposa]
MGTYTYLPLEDPMQEIRLVELLPAPDMDHSIRVRIHHVSLLQERTPPRRSKPSFEEVYKTLPPGWDLYQNPQGRYIFANQNSEKLQWNHPDARVSPDIYEVEPLVDADFQPKYEALSYAWGHASKSQSITVEPGAAHITGTKRHATLDPNTAWEEKDTTLEVSDSSLGALRYLRDKERSRLLWIDTICIQQSDNVEKGHQVSRMSFIYGQAYRVVVWLGLEANGSSHAIQTLNYIGSQGDIDALKACWMPSPDTTEREWIDRSFQLPYDDRTWDAVLAFLSRRWFTRLWVAQEIHLGRMVPGAIIQCGTDTMEYASLRRAICCLEHRDLHQANLRSTVAYIWRLFRFTRLGIFRSVIRTATIGRDCTDPRDKLYGTLGIAPKKFASRIKPDYSDKCLPGDTYKMAVLCHAHQVQRLELFDGCSLVSRRIHAPSWVPDWSITSSRDTPKFFINSQVASGFSRAHFMNDDNRPNVLEVLGLRCATVSHVSQPLLFDPGSLEAVHHVRQWQLQDLDTTIYQPTGETLRTAYALTLINNRVVNRWPQYNLPTVDEWVKQDWDDGLFGSRASSSLHRTTAAISRHVKYALNFCQDRVLVQTHEKYIGLAPGDTRPGDVIAVFLGCSNPIILRPVTINETSSYQVVGEGYVHGLHDGIGFLGRLPTPWRVRGHYTADGRDNFKFMDVESGKITKEDPRLGPMAGWKRVERPLDADDPRHYDFFQNQVSGEITNYDPRWEPTVLEARGVSLTKFSLV